MSRKERTDLNHFLYTLRALADRIKAHPDRWNPENMATAIYAVLWQGRELMSKHPECEALFCRKPSTN